MAIMVYKCPHCGAALEFDASQQMMTCDYCNTTFSVQETVSGEHDSEAEDIREETPEESAYFQDHIKAWHCPSCGADIVADANTAATFCHFCGAPTLVESNLTGDYRPVRLIPFQIPKEEAKAAFLKWCKNGRYTPAGFASEQQLEKITGMYVPFWLFDCQVEGLLSASGTKVHTWYSGDYRYTRKQFFKIRRRAFMHYSKVPADASLEMDNTLMDALEPFRYDQLINFEMPYLAGYVAQKYDEPQNDVYPRIQERVDRYTAQQLRGTIAPYTTINVDDSRTYYHQSDAMYTLLPVWMLAYKYEGRSYLFAMNGQTGKVVGYPPISKKRVALWAGLYGLIAFLVMFVGGGLLL